MLQVLLLPDFVAFERIWFKSVRSLKWIPYLSHPTPKVSESGVHRPHVAGIHGREDDGAYSIVLSGGYEDDNVSLMCTLF